LSCVVKGSPDGYRRSRVRAACRGAAQPVFDAVAAIAITLLALGLPVQGGATVRALRSSVRHSGTNYVAFLISFAVIAAAWSHHHDSVRYAVDMDAGLRELNMAWSR
jgi:uncharacterized membrane protein